MPSLHPVSVAARHLLAGDQTRPFTGERSVVTTRQPVRTPVAQQPAVPAPSHPGWLSRLGRAVLHPLRTVRAAH